MIRYTRYIAISIIIIITVVVCWTTCCFDRRRWMIVVIIVILEFCPRYRFWWRKRSISTVVFGFQRWVVIVIIIIIITTISRGDSWFCWCVMIIIIAAGFRTILWVRCWIIISVWYVWSCFWRRIIVAVVNACWGFRSIGCLQMITNQWALRVSVEIVDLLLIFVNNWYCVRHHHCNFRVCMMTSRWYKVSSREREGWRRVVLNRWPRTFECWIATKCHRF